MFDKTLFALPGIRGALAALAVLALCQAASVVGQALTLACALTNLWAGETLSAQAGLVAAFFALFLLKQLVAFGQDRLLSGYARARAGELRRQLLERAFTGPVGWVRAQGTASVTTSALEGIDQVEAYLRVILPKMVNLVVVLPVALVAVFVLDWVSGIILLVVVPVLVFYMVMLGKLAQERAEKQYGTYRRLSNHFIDTLRGLDTLKALGAGKRQVRGIFETSERFREATVRTLRVATLSGAVLDLLATLGVAAVAMMLGFRLVVGQMALFTGLAVLIISPEYFLPLRQFSGDFHASLDGRNALADILRLVGQEEEDARGGQAVAWDEECALKLSDVSFTYPVGENGSRETAGYGNPNGEDLGKPVLDGISLSAHGFQKIGIIGPSGSGKSTLASLLGGFLSPTGGAIEVNGIPVDLRQESWRRQVLYIPQNPYLFHATLRENIAFYTPDATDGQVAAAIEAVGLSPLVAELPQGLDTMVGEGERGLSGGQAHRIALARALLDADRRILIFDEPTAHLDLETELELKERMLPLMEGRLVIFATHRLHWLEDMDRVFEIADGRLSEIPGGRGSAGVRVLHRRSTHAWERGDEGELPSSNPGDYPAGQDLPRSLGHELDDALAGPRTAPSPRNLSDSSSSTEGLPGNVEGISHEDSAVTETAQHSVPQSEELPKRETPDSSEKSSWKNDQWVRPYFGKYRRNMARALGLGVGAFAFSALLMFTAGYLISGTAEAPGSILLYYLPIAFVQLFGLGKPLLRYLERLESHDWVFRVTSSLRVRLFKALEALPWTSPGERRAGDVLGVVSEDIGHIQNLYLRTIFPLVIAWVVALLAVSAFAIADPLFSLAALGLLGLVGVAAPLVSLRILRPRFHRLRNQRRQLYRGLTDDMLGMSDWVFSGRGAGGMERRIADAEQADAAADAIDRFIRLMDLAVAAVLGLAICLVLVWAAGRFGGTIGGPANWIAAFALGLFPLIEVFAPLPAAAAQANAHRASIEHLNDFPATDDGIPGADAPEATRASEHSGKVADEGEGAIEGSNAEPIRDQHAVGTHAGICRRRAEPSGFDLIVEQASFGYPSGSRAVIDALDLTVPAGQRVAVLGRSGSGKSTFAALIHGELAPDTGSVRIGGIATADFGDAMANTVGIVQQNPYLFDRTLRENLTLGTPGASDDELWHALSQVGLEELVRTLPDGLDTMADEAGMRFSGGERHRIALARVLLSDAPIVLLDEPTVGLDPGTEQELLATLFEATHGRTLIMITHHLQGIEAFDRVLFLENGRIELDGSPTQLAATSARYRHLLSFDRTQ